MEESRGAGGVSDGKMAWSGGEKPQGRNPQVWGAVKTGSLSFGSEMSADDGQRVSGCEDRVKEEFESEERVNSGGASDIRVNNGSDIRVSDGSDIKVNNGGGKVQCTEANKLSDGDSAMGMSLGFEEGIIWQDRRLRNAHQEGRIDNDSPYQEGRIDNGSPYQGDRRDNSTHQGPSGGQCVMDKEEGADGADVVVEEDLIPDDPFLAESHYSQYHDDFETDDSASEDDEDQVGVASSIIPTIPRNKLITLLLLLQEQDYKALLECIEDALNLTKEGNVSCM